MYNDRPNLIIGFHGCDESVRNLLVNKPDQIKISKEAYDWLGHGMYFWENDYERALMWAKDKMKREQLVNPSVVGAVLQTGYCFDTTDTQNIRLIKRYYEVLRESYRKTGEDMPVNKNLKNDVHQDMLLRELDCTTIQFMHEEMLCKAKTGIFSEAKTFDSMRGVFTEGGPAFPGSGIFDKSHTQICIRNMNCIKGFFIPRKKMIF